jgi:hypothetical protein
VGKNQHWQKEIIIHWEGLFKKIIELLQHRWQQNWIFILMTISTKTVSHTVGLQLLNLWILRVMLRCVNDGVMSWPQNLETCTWDDQMSRPSLCSLHQVQFTCRENPWKPTTWNAWFQKWNTGEVLWWFGQQYHGTELFGPIITLHGRIIARGARGSIVVQALCCKLEGRGFKSRWCGFFKIDLILLATLALGSTQPLTEMSTRNL